MRGRASKEGDTKISPNGYHYTRTATKWELTGRLVAAKKLGRELRNNERVRFLDGNQLNLSPDNIRVTEVKQGSSAAKRARLEAKLQEIQAKLEELELT